MRRMRLSLNRAILGEQLSFLDYVALVTQARRDLRRTGLGSSFTVACDC